mmetsp:Transcript_4460/g.14872  ORF Transcript_4460/g.14872 Transcript_4460/m.14872 type:complete len:209 (-) Transcript_4460:569-1195(-)
MSGDCKSPIVREHVPSACTSPTPGREGDDPAAAAALAPALRRCAKKNSRWGLQSEDMYAARNGRWYGSDQATSLSFSVSLPVDSTPVVPKSASAPLTTRESVPFKSFPPNLRFANEPKSPSKWNCEYGALRLRKRMSQWCMRKQCVSNWGNDQGRTRGTTCATRGMLFQRNSAATCPDAPRVARRADTMRGRRTRHWVPQLLEAMRAR